MGWGCSSIKQRIKCPAQGHNSTSGEALNVDKVADKRPQDTYAIGVAPITQGRSPNVVGVISYTIRNCF